MTQMKKIFALCLVLILAASALAGCSSKPGKYEILVTDEAGDPVEGITIQFCSDTLCDTQTTDATGIAAFEKEPGKYCISDSFLSLGITPKDGKYGANRLSHRKTIPRFWLQFC